jgi:ketosteroid isomerase-like protein
VPEKSTTPNLEEALRRSMGAVNRRDFDAAMTLYAPNAVWDASPMGLDVFEGREAIRGFFDDWWGSYEDFEQVLEEFHDLGNGVTRVVSRQRARLHGSSAFVELRYAAVATWIGGLVERVTVYSDIDEARADAERLAQERG